MADTLDPTILFDAATDTATLTLYGPGGHVNTITLPGTRLMSLFMAASEALCRRHRLPGQSPDDPNLIHGIRQYTLHRLLPGNGLVLDLDLATGARLRCYTGNTPTPEFARKVCELWRGEIDLPEPQAGPSRPQ